MVKRSAGASVFHKEGPMDAKDLNGAIWVLTEGTKTSSRSEDRRGIKGIGRYWTKNELDMMLTLMVIMMMIISLLIWRRKPTLLLQRATRSQPTATVRN